jgi:hypothetical protein
VDANGTVYRYVRAGTNALTRYHAQVVNPTWSTDNTAMTTTSVSGKAVKAGVLALIVMDAAWVSISGNFVIALFVLILLPISIKLAKVFAVT